MDYIKYDHKTLPTFMPNLVDVIFTDGQERRGVFANTIHWAPRCKVAKWREAQDHTRCANCGAVHPNNEHCKCGHNSEVSESILGRYFAVGEPDNKIPIPPVIDILHAGKTKKLAQYGIRSIEVDWDPETRTVTYWRPSVAWEMCTNCQKVSAKGEPCQCGWTKMPPPAKPAPVMTGTTYFDPPPPKAEQKHSHYFRPCPYDAIDVYRIIEIFGVTDPCIQHALKKLLVAGSRGHKDITRDVQDVIDTMERWKAMRAEESKS